MNNDLILLWPNAVDYPLFRLRLPKIRPFFNKLIICITTCNLETNLEEFIRSTVDGAIFVKQDNSYQDWVTAAMIPALELSSAQYVTVMHQDFFIHDIDSFFNKTHTSSADLIGYAYPYKEYPLIQPIYWRMKRSILEKTQHKFESLSDEGFDSFTLISRELHDKNKTVLTFEDLGIGKQDYYHLQGATEGFVWGLDKSYQFGKPMDYYVYAKLNLRAKVICHPFVTKRYEGIANRLEDSLYKDWGNIYEA